MSTTIAVLRRAATTAQWLAVNPIIPDRQLAFSLNAGEFNAPLVKIGNGIDNWADLPYFFRKNNLNATTNPTSANDDSEFYSIGSFWLNKNTPEMFVLTGFASGAIWEPIGALIPTLSLIGDVPDYPDDGYSYVLTETDGVLSWEIPSGGGGSVDSVNGEVGIVVLDLEDIDGVPPFPNDGSDYVLVENNGLLTWELYGGSNEGFYVSETFTGASYNLIHNFGAFPAVQLLDSTNAVVIPLSIVNNTINDLTVTFTTSGTYTVIATIGSPQLPNYVSTAVNITASTSGNIIEVTAAGVTITLPTASAIVVGYEYKIDNSSAGNITVVGQGGETIQGLASQTIPSNSCINVYSNGTNWRIN